MNVLLVSDSATLADQCARALAKTAEFAVIPFPRTAEPADDFKDRDLVIVDVREARAPGLSLISRLRAGLPLSSLLAIGERFGVADDMAVAEAGGDGYLGFPFRDSELLAKIFLVTSITERELRATAKSFRRGEGDS